MFEIFQYGFILRGLEAGIIVGVVAPLIGIFLVLRGYSLITDTLAHVSLAGIALGFLFGWSPIVTALMVTVASSVGIDRLRTAKHVFGESALALFLSGSLALATVLLSLSRGFNTSLLNYLFGSIVTVTQEDVFTILMLAAVVVAVIAFLYKELVFVSFDESAAKVSGIPVRAINTVFIILAATTISLSIPIVGVLLIGALMVIPVLAALQLERGFLGTLIAAEIISLVAVVSGVFVSYYLNLATGGTIVLIALAIFGALALLKRFS
jgi:zinc transport system permease protein